MLTRGLRSSYISQMDRTQHHLTPAMEQPCYKTRLQQTAYVSRAAPPAPGNEVGRGRQLIATPRARLQVYTSIIL
jgi:hypothetical protein